MSIMKGAAPVGGDEVRIGIIAANEAEAAALEDALATFDAIDCPYQLLVQSVWSGPRRVLDWARDLEERGAALLLAAAGKEPQTAGLLAAACNLPVLALPLRRGATSAALASAASAAVTVVRSGSAEHAAMAALRILAAAEPAWGAALSRLRGAEDSSASRPRGTRIAPTSSSAPREQARPRRPADPPMHTIGDDTGVFTRESMRRMGREQEYSDEAGEPVDVRPVDFSRPLRGEVIAPAPREEPNDDSEHDTGAPRPLGRREISPEAPEADLIEDAVDCLLEGGVVAFPTETVYGLAADATNPAAVARLYELKGRPRNKAISLMVDQPRLLASIAQNLTVEVRRLMEAFWPGPLTLILQKRPGNFDHVGDAETIGVRLPDHPVPLALIQALARPLACTSANLSGESEATSADEIQDTFGKGVHLVLDGGMIPENPPSTVLDVTAEPFRILRLGAIGHEQLAAILGEKLESEG